MRFEEAIARGATEFQRAWPSSKRPPHWRFFPSILAILTTPTATNRGEALIPFSGEDWFDPLEETVRPSVRGFFEAMVDEELRAALGGRGRYHPSKPAEEHEIVPLT